MFNFNIISGKSGKCALFCGCISMTAISHFAKSQPLLQRRGSNCSNSRKSIPHVAGAWARSKSTASSDTASSSTTAASFLAFLKDHGDSLAVMTVLVSGAFFLGKVVASRNAELEMQRIRREKDVVLEKLRRERDVALAKARREKDIAEITERRYA